MARRKHLKVYLDICCFNRPFDDQVQLKIKLETDAKLFVQQQILLGKYQLVWSYILDYENSKSPFKEQSRAIAAWEKLSCETIDETPAVLARAKKLIDSGIKTMDALHIACAAESGCDYFITTDRRLLSAAEPDVKIVNPVQFIQEIEVTT